MNAELGRDVGAVKLYGSLVDAEVGGDLLVELALEDVPENLRLTVRERLKEAALLPQTGGPRTVEGVALQRAAMAASRSSLGAFLVRKSSAPPFIACTVVGTFP